MIWTGCRKGYKSELSLDLRTQKLFSIRYETTPSPYLVRTESWFCVEWTLLVLLDADYIYFHHLTYCLSVIYELPIKKSRRVEVALENSNLLSLLMLSIIMSFNFNIPFLILCFVFILLSFYRIFLFMLLFVLLFSRFFHWFSLWM